MKENKQEVAQRIYKIIMLIILTVFITFMVTSLTLYSYFTKNPVYTLVSGDTTQETSTDIDKYLSKISSIIKNKYLWNENIDEKKLNDSAIEGYVSGLGDKYTEYIPKSKMSNFKEEIYGSFIGIGIYMVADEKSGKIIVYYPIPDSPAEKAGIKSGDSITKVDGVEYTIKEFNTIADKIKGKEGTTVKLTIEREGKNIDFEIERKKIEINPIKIQMMENTNIGYVKLSSFDTDTSKKFKESVDELVSKGAKSLIIDLRNNGGGIVDEAENIADLFLDKDKTILTSIDNTKKEEVSKTKNDKTYSFPVVILVNSNTASSSEILTGALKENNRATIIGTKTYGKGVIQTVIPLEDGSALKITTAEYLTPSGEKIHEKGIMPNIEVELSESVKNEYAVKFEDDIQLKKAIEELSK